VQAGNHADMADELIFLTRGDTRGERILATFAERTGLTLEPIAGGARFELDRSDHSVPVVKTLTDIDPDWSRHMSLGDPAASQS